MAALSCMWIISVIILLTSDAGALGRAVDSFGFLLQSPRARDGPFGEILRTDGVRRWRRGVAAEAHGERCAELGAAWLENTRPAPERGSTVLQLRVRPFSPGPSRGLVFPGKSLFTFIRRVYRCCQERVGCRSVKGIQGRLRGAAGVEFVLTREILATTVSRAELHLQLSNPLGLDISPVIPFMAKRNLPTRYSVASRGDAVELRVELLFLLRLLQEAAGNGGRSRSLVNAQLGRLLSSEDKKTSLGIVQDADGEAWHDRNHSRSLAWDVGLVLGCSRAGSGVPCESGGVHLSDAPFMALFYT
ncbi:uncharacterized protein LOC103469695 [Poecilia reticulata]|uniref:uncharacterized protein LOC103469695 n=1 Tax=Poecilia reticulata TaxID=8081 RepID=UPI0004A2FE2A|nr:PREDICTED: uncharacterized protein LOC103469695 [Poecilia reticulata]